ncbi:MAG: hypothetical protein LBN18_05725 [Dysgonamonadaceae bacterium]|jgi:hypothetical protein|nr:hypothetical protein [Dysgonamonadaceae bacterium]
MKTCKQTFSVIVLLVLSFGFFACSNVAQKFLEVTAEQYNKQLPQQLNEFIRMDRCEAAPDLTLKFLATILMDTEGADFQESLVSAGAKKAIIRTLQDSPEFDTIKKFGIKYLYSYSDANGKHLYDVLITPEDYNNPLPEDSDDEITIGLIESSKLEVQSIQKMLPLEMGNGITMTTVRFLEDGLIDEYTCTLQGEVEETAKKDVNAFIANSKPAMIKNLTGTLATMNCLEHGFSYRYIYNDSKGNPICTIDITKEDIE